MLVVPDSSQWRVPGSTETLPSHGRQLGLEQGSSILHKTIHLPAQQQLNNKSTITGPLPQNNTDSTISRRATLIHTKTNFSRPSMANSENTLKTAFSRPSVANPATNTSRTS